MPILPFFVSLLGRPPGAPRDATAQAIDRAQTLILVAIEAGRDVPAALRLAVDRAGEAIAAGAISTGDREAFLDAYRQLVALTADLSKRPRTRREYPFEDAIEEAELLLHYAAQMGLTVDPAVAAGIIDARSKLKAGTLDDATRAAFYARYGELSAKLDGVTAETIRCCSGALPRRALAFNRWFAIGLTAFVTIASVLTFVGNAFSQRISDLVVLQNANATALRASLDEHSLAGPLIADPCGQIAIPANGGGAAADKKALGVDAIQNLQMFAAQNREMRSQAIKLNWMLSFPEPRDFVECDPFINTGGKDQPELIRGCRGGVSVDESVAAMQLNPAIANYGAEVLCKIKAFQSVRDFANNVQADYQSAIGGFKTYVLPILFAWLGAFAHRLRLFAETIRRRTYHPSFADSARMITAVIAGSIVGLFPPLQGATLTPLAVAFLVGFGVELFFKALDNLTGAFGAGPKPPPS